MKRRHLSLGLAALSLSLSSAYAQTKWDLPAAYAASNFHSENLIQFASDVDKATAGKLKITVHANASLFKANEIKRAVQGGQAQIGEVLLVNFENENPIYGADGVPFLATLPVAAAARGTVRSVFAVSASLRLTALRTRSLPLGRA